ncbi:multicopper oxidase family protein [Duganella sp. CT11-25]|uniref:multicopper oxidase family protein n=1 Tax=unclassified Duganella TaxID=2636909 RepID=UPI0039AF4FD2
MRYAKIALVLAATAACQASAAEIVADVIDNPPVLGAGKKLLQAGEKSAPPRLNLLRKADMSEVAPGVPREVELSLAIQYVNGWIRNPSLEAPGKIKYDKVSLRSYVQGVPGKAHSIEPSTEWGPPRQTAFVAPQIEAYPGQTVRVTLNNNLPFDPTCIKLVGGINVPHCFNGTNLHSHGLWVNPAGNSDNVLISINPGVGFQYEYNIPPTHPAGTFWYHTHVHGSTALQVSSGMGGALIVRGTRKPTETENGDVDTLLKPFPERVLMFQQIQYACRYPADAEGIRKIKTYGDEERKIHPKNDDFRYKCDEGDVGRIDGYDQLAPSTWRKSGRYTSINGVVMGKLVKAKAGVVERWRMIHGGVRDTIALKIRRLAADAPPLAGLTAAAETEDYVRKYCTGPELEQSLVAADGLTLAKVMRKKEVIFQPAYRWDALVVFPAAGNYCLVNDVEVMATIDRAAPSAQLLGLVEVEGGTPVAGDARSYLQNKLIASAQANLPQVKAKVTAELKNGLSLRSFVPHETIADNEVTGTQTMIFNIKGSSYEVNGAPFDPKAPPRSLPLGGVEEWTLTSDFVSHPFHIHVNPFQILKILAPDGTDISGENAVDPDGKDSQYAGLKGVWKDTIWVKNLFASDDPAKSREGRYTVVVRTRYERYIGDFVLHCHILDHEDQGMMQGVRVVLPDGAGGTAHGHH